MAKPLPSLTADQMREVDRIMIEELGIELIQMMENAGRNLARLAIDRYQPDSVVVLAGSGGNGGGGLVAARHLANRGVDVTVTLSAAQLGEVPTQQLDISAQMGVPASDQPPSAALVIDALIGYSLAGDPRGRAKTLIEWANAQPSPVLALDSPSGLDVTGGRAATPCIWADATMTLALPKTGLLTAPQVGDLYLADISVPPSVYERMGLDSVNPFRDSEIIAL